LSAATATTAGSITAAFALTWCSLGGSCCARCVVVGSPGTELSTTSTSTSTTGHGLDNAVDKNYRSCATTTATTTNT
jgi:hypothetical protein